MNNIMLDLETLGTGSNATVVSISIVPFKEDGTTGEGMELGLDILSQMLEGSEVDKSTIDWWASQSIDAKNSLVRLNAMPIAKALTMLNEVMDSNTLLWGNGATFDNVILRNLYKRHNIDFAVPFWNDRCVRTLCGLASINTRKYIFKGTRHKGIDDCKHQIRYCKDAFEALGVSNE